MPSRRMRLLADANSAMRDGSSGRSVSWCRTTSGQNVSIAAQRDESSNTVQTTGSAPSLRKRSAVLGERVMAETTCPTPTGSGISLTPMTPLPPAIKIRISDLPPSTQPAWAHQHVDMVYWISGQGGHGIGAYPRGRCCVRLPMRASNSAERAEKRRFRSRREAAHWSVSAEGSHATQVATSDAACP